MDNNKLIVGLMKVRNEIVRSGNIYRSLLNMQNFCDDVYVCDDASYDGTYEYLKTLIPEDHILRVEPKDHDFRKELLWKQKLLDMIHQDGPWGFIWWQDADEVLDRQGTDTIREFCKARLNYSIKGYKFHYTQLWRNSSWARTDDGFDNGHFIKLWKWCPTLRFNVLEGTHHAQFPAQVGESLEQAPFDVIHFGNFGVNLRWKCIQYYGGLGGVDRHLRFENAEYRKVPKDIMPPGVEHIPGNMPEPFTTQQIDRILSFKDLKNLEKTFCVIIPTYNRGHVLRRTLDSLLKQTYDKWIAVVLDDASTDDTSAVMWEYQEKDPRFFYGRYLSHAGGVGMNEIGMEIAMNTCEYWTRLGSDDWFLPQKLERDVKALEKYKACYGPFVVNRNGNFAELCSGPMDPQLIRDAFNKGGFEASWVNVACKSSILRKVKDKFGNFVDPRLQNMEDRLFNFRVLKFCDFVWRGQSNGVFYINPNQEERELILKDKENLEVEGVWSTDEKAGSSYNSSVYALDYNLTTEIINKEKDL